MKTAKVRILNPLPGEVKFTSVTRAARYVEQGIATLQAGGLFFTHSLRNVRRERREIDDYWVEQRQCIPWAGRTANSQLLFSPGEIRS